VTAVASALERLQAWFLAQCDGAWEHGQSVTVATPDNPGWQVQVNLEHTRWAGREFVPSAVNRSEHDWCHCWVKDNYFQAACGPCNLEEAIGCFLEWAGVPDVASPSGVAVDDIYKKQSEWSEP
jgi:hypothetical protein